MARQRGNAAHDPSDTADYSTATNGATAGEPTYDEIALEAYGLWAARGGQDGSDVDDWLEAERRLREGVHDSEGSTASARR